MKLNKAKMHTRGMKSWLYITESDASLCDIHFVLLVIFTVTLYHYSNIFETETTPQKLGSSRDSKLPPEMLDIMNTDHYL